jgi:hypothetical protein
MKKLFSFTLFLLFVTSLTAQEWTFGPKAGINFNYITFSDSNFDTSSKLGIHIGGFVNYSIDEKVSLQTELAFVRGGNKSQISTVEFEARTNNFFIPVLFQYEVADNLRLEAGPNFTLLTYLGESNEGENDYDEFTDAFKTFNLGYGIGAIYDLDSLVENLSAGVRYVGNFSGLNKEDDRNGGEVKQSNILVSFYYRFGKKSEQN